MGGAPYNYPQPTMRVLCVRSLRGFAFDALTCEDGKVLNLFECFPNLEELTICNDEDVGKDTIERTDFRSTIAELIQVGSVRYKQSNWKGLLLFGLELEHGHSHQLSLNSFVTLGEFCAVLCCVYLGPMLLPADFWRDHYFNAMQLNCPREYHEEFPPGLVDALITNRGKAKTEMFFSILSRWYKSNKGHTFYGSLPDVLPFISEHLSILYSSEYDTAVRVFGEHWVKRAYKGSIPVAEAARQSASLHLREASSFSSAAASTSSSCSASGSSSAEAVDSSATPDGMEAMVSLARSSLGLPPPLSNPKKRKADK